jgi:hypothetical protein
MEKLNFLLELEDYPNCILLKSIVGSINFAMCPPIQQKVKPTASQITFKKYDCYGIFIPISDNKTKLVRCLSLFRKRLKSGFSS